MKLIAQIAELPGPRQLHFRSEVLDGDSLQPDQILGRTLVSVISTGTEMAAYRGAPPLRPMKVYPRLVGYCNVAEVLACGSAVTVVTPGMRILTNQSHRSAFICRQAQVLATVPAGLDPAEAATAYLFNLGFNALQKGDFAAGQNVAVIGLGALGLSAAALAAALGGKAFGLSDQALAPDFAARFGLAQIFSKQGEAAKTVQAAAGDQGIDLVVMTSNAWHDWQLALMLPAFEGTISVVGFPGRDQGLPDFNPLNSQYFYDRQLRIIAAGFPVRRARRTEPATLEQNCRRILDMIAAGALPARALISDTVTARDIQQIYERAVNREAGLLTAALEWRD